MASPRVAWHGMDPLLQVVSAVHPSSSCLSLCLANSRCRARRLPMGVQPVCTQQVHATHLFRKQFPRAMQSDSGGRRRTSQYLADLVGVQSLPCSEHQDLAITIRELPEDLSRRKGAPDARVRFGAEI